jgi:ribosomal-protein-alanine N-acetyltransferase
MARPKELVTDRLVLRRWLASDRAPFAALNADPIVMEHYPALLSREESDAFVNQVENHFERFGWGLWAVEARTDHVFIGYVGLWPATFDAPFTPAVEVGWRLARQYWGRGLATEAGRASITDGFACLGVEEIVSFTSTSNVRSQRVMQKLGMHSDPADDFEHPAIAAGHPLCPHVLYRLDRASWPHQQRPGLRAR